MLRELLWITATTTKAIWGRNGVDCKLKPRMDLARPEFDPLLLHHYLINNIAVFTYCLGFLLFLKKVDIVTKKIT